ncbi:MAG: O-antigen ligase family protein [Tepidisphaeraceae bacterium]
MDHAASYQLRNVLEALGTGEGMLALAALVLLGVVVAGFPPGRWLAISLLMFTSALGYFRWVPLSLIPPFEQLRANGRGICFALLVLLLIPAITSGRGWRVRLLSGGLLTYFVFQMVFSARTAFAGDAVKGVLAAASFTLTFLTLGWGLSRWLQRSEDAHAAVRAIALAGILFCLGTAVQLTVRPNSVVWQNRLLGLTGNPQHAAVLLAVALPPTCFLLARSGRARLGRRLAIAACVGLMVIMLVWTGSRTGALMTLVGLALLFRLRLGRLLAVVVAGGVFVLVAAQIFSESIVSADRLLATDDTRTAAWMSMWADFLRSPWIGIELEEARYSENSYLLTASRTGLLGLIPLLLAVILVIRGLLHLQSARARLGEHALLADLVTGGLVALGVGSLFEGHLVAVYSFPMYAVYIYLGVMAFLLDAANAPPITEVSPPVDAAYGDPMPEWEYSSALR